MKNERRLLRVARCAYLLSLLTRLLSKWLNPDRDDRRKLESETSPPLSYPLDPSQMRMNQRLRITNLRNRV